VSLKKTQLLFFYLFSALFAQEITAQTTHANPSSQIKPSYFDTEFLSNYSQVKKQLIEDGFESVTFMSPDGCHLNGLYRSRANATHNAVVCAGFYPGKKEGMATFAELLPENCNILLIDARGHGESDGSLWKNILWYGQNEYKDILGALNFLCTQNNNPNFLIGVCIGAFHCAHATIALEKQNNFKDFNLQGIIFDSGFASLTNLLWIPANHFSEKVLPAIFSTYLYTKDTKKSIKNRLLYKVSAFFTTIVGSTITLSISPFFYWYDSNTTLFNKIEKIKTPIQFVHYSNDTYATLQVAEILQNNCPNSRLLVFNESKHALNHILHQNEYKALLLEFITNNMHT